MDFKYIEIDTEEYSRLNEIEYKKQWEKKEIIHFLAIFTFKIFESCSVEYKISIDEDIEILYFEILNFIKNQDYNVPKTLIEKANSDKLIKLAESYKMENNTTLSDDDIKRVDFKIFTELNKPLYKILEFRQHSIDGIIFNKRSIGYEVYLEFKRKFLNKQNSISKKINIYQNLEDFKENYLVDFSLHSNNIHILKYLKSCEETYKTEYDNSRYIYPEKFSLQTRLINEILTDSQNLILHRMLFAQEPEYLVLKNSNTYYNALNHITPIDIQHKEYINEYAMNYEIVENEKTVINAKRKKLNEIVQFIKSEIEREKINLLRFQGNTHNQIEYKTEPDHENDFEDATNDKKKIFYFFNKVRNEDLGGSDVIKLLKEYSDDFNVEVLNFILKDLDFYLFTKREEKESEYSHEDIDNAIQDLITKGVDLPYHKSLLNLDTPILDKEKLLFPYEFYSLYSLKNIIISKISSLTSNEINKLNLNEIPDNDFSDSVQLERMIILEKLGILKYIRSLQTESDKDKHTAEILSAFTGINAGTIAKNLGVMMGVKKNDNDSNSPYNNPKNLELANKKFDQFRIDLTKILK